VYNPNHTFSENCNMEMVDLDPLSVKDEEQIVALLHKHVHLTGSKVAKQLLANWSKASKDFVKVYPKEYKKVLEKLQYQTVS
jgi:glutamate synthase (NADPH/NADH) large chain